jgi:hypothetical protein
MISRDLFVPGSYMNTRGISGRSTPHSMISSRHFFNTSRRRTNTDRRVAEARPPSKPEPQLRVARSPQARHGSVAGAHSLNNILLSAK